MQKNCFSTKFKCPITLAIKKVFMVILNEIFFFISLAYVMLPFCCWTACANSKEICIISPFFVCVCLGFPEFGNSYVVLSVIIILFMAPKRLFHFDKKRKPNFISPNKLIITFNALMVTIKVKTTKKVCNTVTTYLLQW